MIDAECMCVLQGKNLSKDIADVLCFSTTTNTSRWLHNNSLFLGNMKLWNFELGYPVREISENF
jgi:hypothetical protein